MLCQKLRKISELYVPVKKVSVTKAVFSTVSFLTSCVKVVISLITMALEANPFMEISLAMKTLLLSTQDLVCIYQPYYC